MPFLVDKGPPVDAATLTAARNELPREYGVKVVDSKGTRSLLARVPRAKPDYNYELAMVAFYVSPDDLKDVKDVLLIGDEKTVRMEPLRLRDHVREQIREDKEHAPALRARLAREYGWTTFQSPGNQNHKALVLRVPVASMAEADQAVLLRARAALGNELVPTLQAVHYVYVLADNDFARVGRRVFVEAVASDLAAAIAVPDSKTANPLHLGYATPGHFIAPQDLPRG
ncbi:MAG TPA: hypothetical protein VHH36_04265 [Candidatus Thermoplasmatota archaeon]|nr:hypothetical protein [Candidatus Thermoplasmatota archaeon]